MLARIVPWAMAALLLSTGQSNGDDGDIFRRVVSNFTSMTPSGPSREEGFMSLNRAKTFEIFELADRYRVLASAVGKPMGETNYISTSRSLFGAFGIAAEPSFNIEVMAIGDLKSRMPQERIQVSLLNQSDTSVNTWFLTCIDIN